MRTITDNNVNSVPRNTSYDRWTIEELRAFGVRMQLRDASRKTRSELLELLGVPSRPADGRN